MSKTNLDNMLKSRWLELINYSKKQLRERKISIQPEDFIAECYIYLLKNEDYNKEELDYLKMAKRWIYNQSMWVSKAKLPKSGGESIKSKFKTIGDEIDRSIEYNFLETNVDFDDNIDFALWIADRLDRTEIILFNLIYIDELNHKKIAEKIRATGIKISDSSVYNMTRDLRVKLKKEAEIWRNL